MSSLPFVSCICPTFRRPRLLANAVACYLGQDYPQDRRELIILDDDDAYENLEYKTPHGNYKIVSHSRKYETLTEKYNALAAITEGEVLAVWEDDDIYLPWHLSTHVKAIGETKVPTLAKASTVLSTYGRKLNREPGTGRFHASLVFNREALETIGGWPNTPRADFDQQFIQELQKLRTVDPLAIGGSPSYIFRWETTNASHGQAFMTGPDDSTWFSRSQAAFEKQDGESRYVYPVYDTETESLIKELSLCCGPTV